MKKYISPFAFSLILLSSCVTNNKVTAPIVFTQVNKPETSSQSLVPFTRDLYKLIKASNLNIQDLQFFISQTVVLSRVEAKEEIKISHGELTTNELNREKKIEFLALTPGIIESIDKEGMYVRFEKGEGNFLRFINNKYSPINFTFNGEKWNNGTAFTEYGGTEYLASCGNCSSVAEAKLLIKIKDKTEIENFTHQPPGIIAPQ